MSFELKNTIAKVTIILWIAFLIALAIVAIVSSITFNVNQFLALTGQNMLSPTLVKEVKVILLMMGVSVTGGVCFIIKDFYRSIKNANLYDQAYEDYSNNRISLKEFQRLIPIEVYTGRFNHTWIFWFLIQPILSTALGAVAFFIARSGLGVLQGTSTVTTITIQSIYMYAVFTFLAGFSSHKFIAWLDRLADKIFSTTLPEQKESIKEDIQEVSSVDREALKSDLGKTKKKKEITLEPTIEKTTPEMKTII